MPNPNPFLRSPLADLADETNASVIQAAQQQAPVEPDLPEVQAAPVAQRAPAIAAPRTASRPQSLIPPPELNDVFEASAQAYGVPVNVLMALAQQESGYNPRSINKASGAKGIMNYMDATASSLGIDPYDPNQAIPAAAKQLRDQLDLGHSIDDAVRHHFAGPDRKLWGANTAAYGDEVLGKAGKIGSELYGPAPTASTEPVGKPYGADLDPNKLSTSMNKMDYLAAFMKVNPNASAGAQEYAMNQYDKEAAARTKAAGNRVQDKFAQMQSPEAAFDAKLNAKLQARNQGVAQVQPGRISQVDAAQSKEAVTPLQQASNDVGRGIRNLQALGYGLGGLAADELGYDDKADQFLNRYVEISDNNARDNPAEIGTYKKVKSASDASKYAAEAILENLPMFLPALVSGGVGAVIARKAAEKTVGGMVEAQIANGVSRAVAEKMAAQFVAKRVMIGSTAGAAPASVGMESGSIMGDIYKETGQKESNTALAFGIPAGLLDTLTPVLALRKIAGPAADAVAGGLIRRLGTEAGMQFISEAGTEGLQTILEEAAKAKVTGKDLFTPELMDQVIDAALKGGIGGSAMGMASQAVGEVRSAVANTPNQQIANAINDQAQNADLGSTDAAVRASMDPSGANAIDPAQTRVTPAPQPTPAPAAPIQDAQQVVRPQPTPQDQTEFAIPGEDGSMHTLNADGTIVETAPAPAGPLSAALGGAMAEHAANPQQIIEAPQPEPVQASPEPPAPPAIESYSVEQLQARLKEVATSIKQTRTPELVAERKQVEKELAARKKEAIAASKPAEEPVTLGPFDERTDANRMMIRAAEQTGAAHEVVEQDGKFAIRPIKESGNDVSGSGDDRGSSNRPADRPEPNNGAGPANDADVQRDGRTGDARGRSGDNGPDSPGAVATTDAQPALKEWERNPYSGYSFSTPEAAEAFVVRKSVDRNQFEAVQTGKERWKVQPRLSEADKAMDAQFEAAIQEEAAAQKAASDSSVIAKPAAKAARKPAAKKKVDKPAPRVIDEEGYLAENGASRQDFGDAALHRSSSNVGESTKRNAIESQSKKDTALAARRQELRVEYAKKVADGELRAPTASEETARIAKGDPASEATQAAQRLIEKRAKREAERAAKQTPKPEPVEEVPAPTKAKAKRKPIAPDDVPDLNDLNDASQLSSDGPLRQDEPAKRVMVLAELKRLQKLRERGRVPEAYIDASMSNLIAKIGERNEAKEDARLKDKERGPEWVEERLLRAKRKGELDANTVDFALWALRKSPSIAEGLAISLRAASEQGTAGSYRSAERLMTLFKEGGNTGTAVHEMLHHTERMMPRTVQDGISKAWQKAYTDAWNKADPKQRAALEKMIEASAGSKAAHKEMVKAFNNGTLKYDQHYQLTNASEFWAVNATRIMAGRYDGAKGGWTAKAKQWLGEMAQKFKGLLGMKSDAPILKALDEVLNGEGKMASPKMLLESAVEVRDITGPTPPAQPDLTPPEQGVLRRLQAGLQNNMNRVVQVQDRIVKLIGGKIVESADYYGAETNRPGRIAARLEDAQDKMLQPMMERLAAAKHTPEQLQELLHAMHAEERNAAVAKINPKFDPASAEYVADSFGSGMSPTQAREIMRKYRDADELHAIANTARDISQATLDLKLEYGLMTPEQHKTLTDAYEHYVPLKGDGEYGPKNKRAMGHEARDEQIMGNIARDYAQAVTVGEKNLSRQSLLQMVLRHPDDNLWTARIPPKGRYIAGTVFNVVRDGRAEASFTAQSQVAAFLEAKGAEAHNYVVQTSAGEQVVEFTKTLQDNEVMVYVKGQPVRLQIHDETLARQLRPLGGDQMNVAMEALRSLNRHLSKVYTGYNPSFILRNTARDALTGTINMIGNQGTSIAAKAWKNYPQSALALGRWARNKEVPAGRGGDYLREYRDQGGKVGASWMSDLEQQGKSLTEHYDNARGLMATARDTGASSRTAVVAWNKTVGRLAHIIEVANTATENALRLSLYTAMREAGHSPAKAAQAAKTVTVDFDRKGSSTPALGAFYLFLNPAVQGTANLTKTLLKGENRYQAWAAVGALASLGYMLAAKGMDDDKDRWLGNAWEKRSKTFMYQTGNHQITIPVSQEYAPYFAFGTAIAEVSRGESKMGASARVLSSFIDAYFPLNGAFNAESDNHPMDFGTSLLPTILKPYAEIATNRNAFGSKVVPEGEFTKDRPDNLKMNRATKNSAYDKAAQAIANGGIMLGAGKYENDISKVSPEVLKLLWRTYTGGLGTFIADTGGAAGMVKEDWSQMDSEDFPIIKDFVRPISVQPIQGRYMNLTKEARAAISEFNLAAKSGDGEELGKIVGSPEKARFMGMTKLIAYIGKASGEMADRAVEINADQTLSGSEKRVKLKELDEQKEELYRTGIAAFK